MAKSTRPPIALAPTPPAETERERELGWALDSVARNHRHRLNLARGTGATLGRVFRSFDSAALAIGLFILRREMTDTKAVAMFVRTGAYDDHADAPILILGDDVRAERSRFVALAVAMYFLQIDGISGYDGSSLPVATNRTSRWDALCSDDEARTFVSAFAEAAVCSNPLSDPDEG